METRSSRVLIVDDMPINRMIISSLLATNGVVSDQVECGRDCLTLCEEKDYDLILLDHRMPDLDGVDTLVRLKDIFEKKGRQIPVICHTVEEGRKNINLYKAAGFADVLIKPIDPRQLSEILMTYLPEEDKQAASEEALAIPPETDTEGNPSDEDLRDELDKLPLWLKTVPHIDLVGGIDNCGTADDYIDALYIFYSSIYDKAGEIEYFLEHEDWSTLCLRVHSLKSMARLVGARKLSKLAESMEQSLKAGNNAAAKTGTPALLKEYRTFETFLAPLTKEERIRASQQHKNDADDASEEVPVVNERRTILFINSNSGIVTKGIEKNLKDADFKVLCIPDEPDMIITYRYEADILLYFPEHDDKSHVGLTMSLLGEICQDDTKILCLTGDVADIEVAMASNGAHRVTKCYPRPVNFKYFLRDLERYVAIETEYHRRKAVFIVDDDADYLSIVCRWLSEDYNVSSFSSGEEVLLGLAAATPDLILLDYEMPEMDGYDLMRSIRMEPSTQKIPIIFLTGKNDRDHVFKILEYKPDGYLLKTSQKESLLDAIHRFFAETLFGMATE